MPCIGIIRGFGEGFNATGFVIKLIKALKKRFKTKITYEEIPIGDYMKFGHSLKSNVLSDMRRYDAVFCGDFISRANPVDYTVDDIALALDNNIEYTYISGLGDNGATDCVIAAYFDGGTLLRENERNIDGCTETRICSHYSAQSIVKSVSRVCENRRRRLAFAEDSDNEYCAGMFYKKFEDFTLPMTNFHLLKFSLSDIAYEIIYDGTQFDVIFASRAFSEYAYGTYRALLKDNFTSYTKFANQRCLYYVKSLFSNSAAFQSAPSICSYIIALCDMLKNEFSLLKEADHLRNALEKVVETGASTLETAEFIDKIITELEKPVSTKHSKAVDRTKKYIK